MPEMNGMELLEEVKKINAGIDVIVMTAFASVDNAVDAMRKGAYDYIVKPFQNDDIIISVKRVLEKRRLAEENRYLRGELTKKYEFHNIIGRSLSIQRLFSIIEKVANSNATALLIGESGTGKEPARVVHYSGIRKEKRFVAVNCSASRHPARKRTLRPWGAFTGLQRASRIIRDADGGTLFLTRLRIQASLFRQSCCAPFKTRK